MSEDLRHGMDGEPLAAIGLEGRPRGAGRRFAVVVSRFNQRVTERLLAGARDCLLQHGVAEGDVEVIRVPGAWELPGAVEQVMRTRRFAGVVALGCVIRGETPHFEYVAGEASRGLAELARASGVPVAFGLLTTENAAQAFARAGGERGNKGWDAALSALEMADLFSMLRG